MSGPTWLPPKQPEPARAPQGRALPRGAPGPPSAHRTALQPHPRVNFCPLPSEQCYQVLGGPEDRGLAWVGCHGATQRPQGLPQDRGGLRPGSLDAEIDSLTSMLAELDGGRGHAPRRLDWQAYEAPQPPAYRTGLGSGSLKPNGGSAPAPLLSAAPCGGPAPASYATASTPAGPSFPVQVKVAQPVRGCGPPRRGASQASGPLPGPHFPLPGRADVWGAGYRSHREPGPVSKEEAAGGGRRGGYGPQVPLSQPPEEELERLTKKLVHDMNHPPSGEYFGRCGGCGEDVVGDGAGVVALDRVFHVACFVCSTCRAQLRGQHFYAVERRAYCESCYVATLEKCSTCSQPILDRILRAMGKAYHPGCFTCVVCHRGLDGIPFTVDATSQIHCIEDFHRKFAPRCSVCGGAIMPEPGQEETVRIVALDRSFHVGCYKCEECGLLLSSEGAVRAARAHCPSLGVPLSSCVFGPLAESPASPSHPPCRRRRTPEGPSDRAMGDSDDEYDRRRRDKFRRERSDYDRSRERDERRRGDDWNDREWDRGRERRSRGEYRDYDRNRRERFSPPRHELSPPQKRMRRDWDEHSSDPYHSGYEMPYAGGGGGPTYGPPQPWGHPDVHIMQHHVLPIQARLGSIAEIDLGVPPPVMKTFKEFLLSLDDSVDETEAVKRYNDYKLDFRRQQMQDFFLAHKDEEWFRSKYHPDEVGKRRQEARGALQNRLRVFLSLMEGGWFDNLLLDIDKADAIVKMLDAAVIKMEGGTENDLRILEQEEEEEQAGKPGEPSKKEEGRAGPGLGDGERKANDKDDKKEDGKQAENDSSNDDKTKKSEGDGDKEEKKDDAEKEAKKSGKKRNRKRSGDDSFDEGSVSESESESENGHAEEKEEAEEALKEKEKPKEEEREKPKDPPGLECKPRPLHKTCSLFMRNIAPNISRAEIISLCKRYPGFMRVALSEPQPERRFFRRGWVTFDRSVNIKEICWNLQNIRLRECELSPGVNRDLTRRVRNINGITQHKQIVRNDIKLAAKLIHTLDDRTQLWASEPGTPPLPTSLPSQNPILKNITDYLIEEVSAEEEELLGSSGGVPPEEPPKEGNPAEINVERDDKLIKVLDKLLLYLRIVHSLDYYNTCEYPNEDEMPNRCGIIHVRGPMPPNRISHGEVLEWQKTFEEKLTPLLSVRESLSEEEAQKMGRKDPEQEVEKFVTSNTQELGKDKWLCPLSGKKFKGPEFVRKHIFNKHAEKIEEVKKEVAFFNNFLTDAKRPALPEIKPAQPPGPAQSLTPGLPYPHQTPQGLMPYGQPRPPILGYGAGAVRPAVPTGGPPYPHAPYGAGRGNYDAFRGQGGYPGKPRNRMVRGDPRAIVEYRDLDAPDDVDFF
ncbi:Serrate RNA effector molecule [Manis javanica]|nr:Serrate RNA effector molecule [Manis javanica]